MGKDCNICSYLCWGQINYHGSCCSVEDRDFIIGPHKDVEFFLERLSIKLDRKIEKEMVFINYDEGKDIFPNKSTWQNPKNYPALRLNFDNKNKYCIFYNTSLRFCTVYNIRPDVCSIYKCDFLKENGDI